MKLHILISQKPLATMLMAATLGGASLPALANHTETKHYPLQYLSSGEKSATYLLATGTVIIMHPGSNRTVYKGSTAENYLKNNTVRTVVMAGVGSSSQGTAAMAKLVANRLGTAVAGIVTGQGDSTTWYYGTEGYFIGRSCNVSGCYYSNAASYKLYQMYLGGSRPYRLVGHSKGSFDTANTLFRLRNEGRSSMYSVTKHISLALGVVNPSGLYGRKQWLGTADSLGKYNSTSYAYLSWVDGKVHSINPSISNYLPVTSTTLAR